MARRHLLLVYIILCGSNSVPNRNANNDGGMAAIKAGMGGDGGSDGDNGDRSMNASMGGDDGSRSTNASIGGDGGDGSGDGDDGDDGDRSINASMDMAGVAAYVMTGVFLFFLYYFSFQITFMLLFQLSSISLSPCLIFCFVSVAFQNVAEAEIFNFNFYKNEVFSLFKTSVYFLAKN